MVLEQDLENLEQPEVEQTTEVETSSNEEESSVVTEEEAYSPNYKLKVIDNEFEIPEEFRPLMKDKDSGDKIREIFSKYYGFDQVKEKRNKYRTEVEDIRPKYEDLNTKYNHEVNKGKRLQEIFKTNFSLACETLGVPKDQVFNYAAELLKYEEADPYEQKRIDQRRETNKNYMTMQEENDLLKSQLMNQAKERHELHLQAAFADPQVSDFERMYDERMGKHGAFRNKVNFIGETYAGQNKYVTPIEAVQQVINEYKPFFVMPQTQQQRVNQPQQFNTSQSLQPRPPVIPNLGSGSGVSPVRSKIKSLSELEEYRIQKYGE